VSKDEEAHQYIRSQTKQVTQLKEKEKKKKKKKENADSKPGRMELA